MFRRYAIFYTPESELARWGAKWLGWDSRTGIAPEQHIIADFDVTRLTQAPQKYGFHGTLKAPFTLAADADQGQLEAATASFATQNPAFETGPLTLRHEYGFIALRPVEDRPALRDFAALTVRAFDSLRAPLGGTDIARRRKSRLSPRQDRQMLEWGYPFIFDDFNFHLTLTGRLPEDTATGLISALTPEVAPLLPATLTLDAITLMGEDEDGFFHQIHRYPLTG